MTRIEREQQRTQDGSARNAELAQHDLRSLATDGDEYYCNLSLKYELSQCSAYPEIPKFSSSPDFNVHVVIKVSKAADRFNCNNSVLNFFISIEMNIISKSCYGNFGRIATTVSGLEPVITR